MCIRVYITACIIQKVREVMNCIVNESLIRFGEQLIQCISSQRWLCIVWDTGIQGYRDTGIQGYRDRGIQGYRDTGIQCNRETG